MDGHQLRGARIHRDMMLVSSVCRRALGCEWGGGWCAHSVGITSGWLPRIWGSTVTLQSCSFVNGRVP